ncbi:MAG TPA: hypothetical protein VIT91_01890 [Chthoniobacterales bacterium]
MKQLLNLPLPFTAALFSHAFAQAQDNHVHVKGCAAFDTAR